MVKNNKGGNQGEPQPLKDRGVTSLSRDFCNYSNGIQVFADLEVFIGPNTDSVIMVFTQTLSGLFIGIPVLRGQDVCHSKGFIGLFVGSPKLKNEVIMLLDECLDTFIGGMNTFSQFGCKCGSEIAKELSEFSLLLFGIVILVLFRVDAEFHTHTLNFSEDFSLHLPIFN